MELTQLRYLVAVAETGNFTRASERCGVSQPSLSQQVINLEKELGHKLFHRLGRKAVLTEAGGAFLERSRHILFEVENATKELSDHPTLERRISVGAIPTLAPFILPTLIERCRKRHPNLQIHGHENFRSSLVNLLLEGVIDLAVVALPVNDARIHVEPLFREPLLLVVGKGHPLAARPAVTAADLADETFVMLGSSSSLAAQVQSFCGDHHLQPRIGFRCAQVSTVKALVEMGAGISILPRVARAPDDQDTLAYVRLAGAEPMREVAVLRHVQRYQSRGAEQFLALLREMAKEPARGGS
jgi:LysR family hydrogen peroxide-inducible transcriptional activator